MDLTLLVFLCLLAPINTSDVPTESVAIVNLQECLKFAPTYALDKRILSSDIQVTDRDAINLFNRTRKAEALPKQENATELDHLNARLSQLEFDAYRQSAQIRLETTEEAMFGKWQKQLNAAVKLVALREGITVVLYPGKDLNEVVVSTNRMQQMLSQTHVGFVRDEERQTSRIRLSKR